MADLALDGKCSVCKVEMNQDMSGDPEVFVLHGGMKYLFVSDEQRKMFLANPTKYSVKSLRGGSVAGRKTK